MAFHNFIGTLPCYVSIFPSLSLCIDIDYEPIVPPVVIQNEDELPKHV